MDGKGCWRDNVFIERLWKSVKYEEVYLHAYDSAGHAKTALTRYFDFYNQRRPHTRLIDSRPIRSTSTNRCLGRRQLEPAGDPLIEHGLTVQTNGASSWLGQLRGGTGRDHHSAAARVLASAARAL